MPDSSTDLLSRMRILAALDEAGAFDDGSGLSSVEITSILGMPQHTCNALIRVMFNEGFVRQPGADVWTMTSDQGRKFYTQHSPDFPEEVLLPPPPGMEEEERMDADTMDDTEADPSDAALLEEALELGDDDFDDDAEPSDIEVPDPPPESKPKPARTPRRSKPTPTVAAVAPRPSPNGGRPTSPAAPPPQRLALSFPKPDTLEDEVYGYIKIAGWTAQVPDIVVWCREAGFDADAAKIEAVLQQLLKKGLVETWRNKHKDAPTVYRTVPYSELRQAA